MNIAYLAQTETSTMLLDPDGICLQARARAGRQGAERATLDGATRCVGAQYVASMDRNEDGGLIEKPRLGCPMLFAATNKDGRIYLVRTGPLVHFEEVSSGVHERGSLPLQEQSMADPPTVRFKEYDGSEDATTPFRKARREPARGSSAHGPGPTPRVARMQAPFVVPLPPPSAPAERALARSSERPIASSSLPPPPMRATGAGRTAPPPPIRPTAPPPPARSAGTLASPTRTAPPPPDTPREKLTSLPDEDFELAPPSSVSSSPAAAPAFDLRRRPAPPVRPSSAPPPAFPPTARRR